MKKVSNREVLKFLKYLKELELIETLGIARLLQVDLVVRSDEEDVHAAAKASIEEKEFEVILSEMIDAFIQMEKSKRKFILDVMKEATYNVKEK